MYNRNIMILEDNSTPSDMYHDVYSFAEKLPATKLTKYETLNNVTVRTKVFSSPSV